jgi:hypothetical protein
MTILPIRHRNRLAPNKNGDPKAAAQSISEIQD